MAALLVLVFLRPGVAQVPQLSPAAREIKARVDALPIGGKLTVNMRDGSQYCGNVRSIEADSFSIREVDLKQVLTLRYEDVSKVRKDYGRKGFGGRRVHPRTNLITFAVLMGVLFGVLIGALASDKS